jgi:hypothetical protein
MEVMVNQLNYFRATSTTAKKSLPQIPSFGATPGTHYQYSSQSLEAETQRYNTAQLNLAKVYAARTNQLYLTTLNYTVSDVPVAPQAYPSLPVSYTFNGVTYTEKPIDYSGQVGKNLPASLNGAQGRTPMSLIPAAAAGPWTSAAVLYQFSGLNDVSTCINTLQAYNASTPGGTVAGWLQTPGACPSILTLADSTPLSYACDANGQNCKGSVYDGNTLQPYINYQAATGTTGGALQLSAPVPNNLKFCDPSTPALAWQAQRGGPVLNCGQWYTPKYLASAMPRANVPGGNSDQTFYNPPPSSWPLDILLPGDCSNNLVSQNGNKYPAITTLTGSWPSGAPSSCAVIPSVPLAGTSNLQSPTYTNSRTENGNYETGNTSQGCSIGWIGKGLSNSLPDYDPYLNGGDELAFGLRLPRAESGRDETAGFVLPVKVTAGCYGRKYANPIVYVPRGDLSLYGYTCGAWNGRTSVTCTITDGTVYNLSASNGRAGLLGSIFDVQLVP